MAMDSGGEELTERQRYLQGHLEAWRRSGVSMKAYAVAQGLDVRELYDFPHRAPAANSYCESFIGTLKREALDFFVCFSRSQLAYIISIWARHYNTERPHSGAGMGNNVLQAGFTPQETGPIRSKSVLGGIVRSYYREAA